MLYECHHYLIQVLLIILIVGLFVINIKYILYSYYYVM